MHALGHNVAVGGERGASHDLFREAPFRWLDLPLKGGPLKLASAAQTVRRHVGGAMPHVIHTHYRRPNLGARYAQRRGLPPLLYTLHLSDIPLHGPWRWLSDFGDHVHAPSAAAGRWCNEVAGIPEKRVTLIPHGIDPEVHPYADEAAARRACRDLRLPVDATAGAYVGRFDRPKNEEWLLDLADATRDSLPDLVVVLIGEGPHELALRQQIAERGLESRVRLLAYADPRPVYAACDLLLLPSAREGFSLVCAEAMSTGRAVLRTRTAGVDETVVEGVTGVSTPIDREAILRAAAALLADRTRMASMGRAALRHVREHLTFDRQVAETLALYRRLAAGSRAASPASPAAE